MKWHSASKDKSWSLRILLFERGREGEGEGKEEVWTAAVKALHRA